MSVPFIVPADLSKFSSGATVILEAALEMGWTVAWVTAQHRLVTVRRGDVSFTVPTTNVNSNRLNSWGRTLVRNSDRVDVERFLKTSDSKADSQIITLINKLFGTVEEEDEPLTVQTGAPLVVTRKVDGAESSKTSPTTGVLSMSDGSTLYGCRVCSFRDKTPLAVSKHYATAPNHPTLAEVDFDLATYLATGRSILDPHTGRIADDLELILLAEPGWETLEVAELVVWLAKQLVKLRTPLSPGAAKDRSPEEILEQVALLVDNGRLADLTTQLDTLRDEVAVAHQDVLDARVARDRAVEEATEKSKQLASVRDALRSL